MPAIDQDTELSRVRKSAYPPNTARTRNGIQSHNNCRVNFRCIVWTLLWTGIFLELYISFLFSCCKFALLALTIVYDRMASSRASLACLSISGRFAISSASRCAVRRAGPVIRPRYISSTAVRLDQKANVGAKRDPAPKKVRGGSKVFKNADEAVKDIKSGATILSAGFGLCGTAGT